MLARDSSNIIVRRSDQNFDHYIFKNMEKDLTKKKIQIMIIDDTRKDVELFKELVDEETDLNYTLSVWMNSNEAVYNLEAGRILPDVIVLDLVMPCMHGKIILKRLKSISSIESIPIIIHSSMNNYENVSDVNALDAHAFFAKPINAPAFEDFLLGKDMSIGSTH